MTPEQIAALPYRPCVGVMLMNADGRIFVGQRKDSEVAAWQMPQGGIDKGEAPEAAALRELWEETGVTADLVEVVGQTGDWVTYDLPDELVGKVWKGKYRGQKQLWFLLRFLGSDDQIDIETEHPEFSEWAWLPADQLVANIVPFKREVYAQVVAELGPQIKGRG
ncbi:MAG: RNA pyrophosphohydrolase [Confluentimicrobium sp.]|jgi:putative (di)nucleoside polyphosphate hydrolase|uniref:RNA pyrophosphohydrolase n=1 Tax=Actibacterium sp. TaxID=1872125 RepID=UPI00050EE3E7|nr:RNA pyrophosphohydrolase [Actibacterium sp.]KGB83572.1 RNA pyrophosphohydrolase [Rhodovulum sp. NI22]MBC56878.1 RNA pyrophosphohydrolase [Actibacterium sp.]MDY6858736.1 RNA pyrophosphohydrolase [Pseudomonadota bacterium]|tara:strand:- start:306 stop:800 length:495 start_codon:yes stop_codon:yes gene_type:complete